MAQKAISGPFFFLADVDVDVDGHAGCAAQTWPFEYRLL
jgi:hypothetical protein